MRNMTAQIRETVVILDTNCLLYGITKRKDVVEAINSLDSIEGKRRIVLPSSVLDELAMLSGRKTKASLLAAAALLHMNRMVNKGVVSVARTSTPVDKWILKEAKSLKSAGKGVIVCTADAELRKELKKLAVKWIIV